ncbi:MAG: hypothetical protein ABI411_12795 [Tahibacter sp.]
MFVPDVAIPWFDREDYDAIRRSVHDRRWRDTYEDWLEDAQQAARGLEAKGLTTYRAHVHSDTFAIWCKLTEREINGAALSAFANELAGKAQVRSSAGDI